MLEFILLSTVIILFIIGSVGIIVPIIPSLPLTWFGILIYYIFSNNQVIDLKIVVITGFIAFIGIILDLISNIFGAKFFGASLNGIIGSVVGGFIGFIAGNIFGVLIGSFFGAFIGEYMKHKLFKKSLKAAIGTIVGFLFGSLFKLVLIVMMGIIFIAPFF